jgi:uncharacterized membrane protein
VDEAVASDERLLAETPAEPLEDRQFSLRTLPWPEGVLGLLITLWCIEFIRLPMLRYDKFGTFGFDLGIYDQGTWLLSRGKDPFVTIRGLELFGHHANVLLLAFVPFYRLGAGPIFLLVVQVLAQASGAVAVFLLARDLLKSKWAGVALGGVLLLNPTFQWLTWEFFHPDAVAIGPLLFAYWAARSKRWPYFWVAAALTVICKEDLALAVALLGILIWFRGDRTKGIAVAAGSTAYFFFATRVLIPWQNGIGPFYDTFFGDLGHSPTQVAVNSVRHPGTTWRLASAKDRRSWYWHVFLPWAFVPLLDPRALLIAAATIFVNVVTAFPYTRDYRYHYSAIVVVGCAVATVEAVAWISRRGERVRAMWTLVAGVLVAAVVTSVLWGCASYSHHYRDGTWPLSHDPRVAIISAAVKEVPAAASASVAYNFDTHMAHRAQIYEFPVPWCNINWGVRGEHLDDPAQVQYLVLDRRIMEGDSFDGERSRALLADLLSYEFQIVSEHDGIVVARRVHPPRIPLGAMPPEGKCYPRPSLDALQPDLPS